jgi:alpha-glucosidase
MSMTPMLSGLALAFLAGSILAAEPVRVASPDERIELRLAAPDAPAAGARPKVEVRFRGRALLQLELGLSVQGTNLFARAWSSKVQNRAADTTFEVPFGKSNPVRDHYREATVDWETGEAPVRQLRTIFRAYDDGVAFRYVMPAQAGADSVEVTDESTSFQFAGNPVSWPLYRENYTTSHEGLYIATPIDGLATNRLIDLPFLVQYADGACAAVCEASLRNYAGLYLKADGAGNDRRLRAELAPLPGQPGVKVRSRLPLVSPWRVALIGDNPGRLIESNLILTLNEPSVIADASWIKAGKTTWHWWNGTYQEPVDFKTGLNWETMRHYIDFCARHGIAFHSVISTSDDFPWYQQVEKGFFAAPSADVRKARADLPMERILAYAKSKGVGIRLWVHWKPLSDRLEEAFAQYETWGIAGLMVDFLDRNDQEMVLFAERVLESAARHHLHIHFHGVWAPTGLERTYPNLFNHEGVLNLEYLKWGDECAPPHNLTVPFTRMLAGPMDYHLGGFRSVTREAFKPAFIKPTVLGTRCHHLAMYVVYDNPMPTVSDAPTAYEGQPGFDFICRTPTTWDATRVLSGEVGKSIVVARRKGADWFVGAMTDWEARTLEAPLSFLGPGAFEVETWTDAPDADDLNRLTHGRQRLKADDRLVLRLGNGGGAVARIRPTAN